MVKRSKLASVNKNGQPNGIVKWIKKDGLKIISSQQFQELFRLFFNGSLFIEHERYGQKRDNEVSPRVSGKGFGLDISQEPTGDKCRK